MMTALSLGGLAAQDRGKIHRWPADAATIEELLMNCRRETAADGLMIHFA
jgi:hypothetical protein